MTMQIQCPGCAEVFDVRYCLGDTYRAQSGGIVTTVTITTDSLAAIVAHGALAHPGITGTPAAGLLA